MLLSHFRDAVCVLGRASRLLPWRWPTLPKFFSLFIIWVIYPVLLSFPGDFWRWLFKFGMNYLQVIMSFAILKWFSAQVLINCLFRSNYDRPERVLRVRIRTSEAVFGGQYPTPRSFGEEDTNSSKCQGAGIYTHWDWCAQVLPPS